MASTSLARREIMTRVNESANIRWRPRIPLRQARLPYFCLFSLSRVSAYPQPGLKSLVHKDPTGRGATDATLMAHLKVCRETIASA